MIQSTYGLLQLHPAGQSLLVPPLQQQSFCLKKQLCSLRCWELVWSLSPIVAVTLCWAGAVSNRPFTLEPDSLSLQGERWAGDGKESVLSIFSPLRCKKNRNIQFRDINTHRSQCDVKHRTMTMNTCLYLCHTPVL